LSVTTNYKKDKHILYNVLPRPAPQKNAIFLPSASYSVSGRYIIMATDKQIAANRLNALKSTGPKTPEGRAAVRLNGVKHGLYAETLVLPGESESDFSSLFESYEAEHQPATPTEEALVQQLAMAMWRLRRLYHAEAALFAKERKYFDKLNSEKQLDGHTLTGMAINANQDAVSTFRRQEASLERTFYRATHELQRIHAQRAKLASVSHPAPAKPQASARGISDVQTPDQPPADPTPAPESAPPPQDSIHIVPPDDNM